LSETLPYTQVGRAVPACLLAWLVPGAGHFYLGRREKGALFLGSLLAMFLLGLGMDARLAMYSGFDDPLALLRSVSQMALGLPYLLARGLGYSMGDVTAITHEYGNTFTEVAGLLNVLVILDAHDVAVGRK
jgi:hypothetical protein